MPEVILYLVARQSMCRHNEAVGTSSDIRALETRTPYRAFMSVWRCINYWRWVCVKLKEYSNPAAGYKGWIENADGAVIGFVKESGDIVTNW